MALTAIRGAGRSSCRNLKNSDLQSQANGWESGNTLAGIDRLRR